MEREVIKFYPVKGGNKLTLFRPKGDPPFLTWPGQIVHQCIHFSRISRGWGLERLEPPALFLNNY